MANVWVTWTEGRTTFAVNDKLLQQEFKKQHLLSYVFQLYENWIHTLDKHEVWYFFIFYSISNNIYISTNYNKVSVLIYVIKACDDRKSVVFAHRSVSRKTTLFTDG